MIQLKNITDKQVFHILKNDPAYKPSIKKFQSKNVIVDKIGTFKILPDEGYFAMTSVNLDVDFTTDSKSETYIENGEYQVLPNEGSVGLSDVTITVDVQPLLQDKQVIYNDVGTYNIDADEGYDGLKNVEVTFEYPLEEITDTITENGTYTYEPSEGYKGLSKVDVTVESAKPFVVPGGMKFGSSQITEFPSDWIWSEVEQSTDQSDRFYYCDELLHLPKLVITNATDTSGMFQSCDKISEIDMREWDLSNVIDMEHMFDSCSQLGLVKWGDFNTSLNKNFRYLFDGCTSLQNIPEIDCSSNTSTYSQYNSPTYQCSILKDFGGFKGINKSIYFVDNYCLSYESLLNILNGLADGVSGQTLTLHKDLVNQLSDDDIAIATNKGWSISPSKTITEPEVVTALSQIPSSTYNITSKTYDFSQFTGNLGASGLTLLPCRANIRSFEGNISNANLQYAFTNCSNLLYISLKTNIAGSTEQMFCQNQRLLEVTGLKGYTTNTREMFSYCRLLESVDLSQLDTSQCTSMYGMFLQSGLKEIPVINDTSQCTDMASMFAAAPIITADLRGWDLSKVRRMDYMFAVCGNLQTVMMDSELDPNLDASYMFNLVTTEGTFYYNPAYDYSKIIAKLPATWTAVPLN